jgi:hypothetical protein
MPRKKKAPEPEQPNWDYIAYCKHKEELLQKSQDELAEEIIHLERNLQRRVVEYYDAREFGKKLGEERQEFQELIANQKGQIEQLEKEIGKLSGGILVEIRQLAGGNVHAINAVREEIQLIGGKIEKQLVEKIGAAMEKIFPAMPGILANQITPKVLLESVTEIIRHNDATLLGTVLDTLGIKPRKDIVENVVSKINNIDENIEEEWTEHDSEYGGYPPREEDEYENDPDTELERRGYR